MKTCGNLKLRCGYRYDLKMCKKPKDIKCKRVQELKTMNKLISFFICLIVGYKLQEVTMDSLYPNRPKGLIRNFLYNMEKKQWITKLKC